MKGPVLSGETFQGIMQRIVSIAITHIPCISINKSQVKIPSRYPRNIFLTLYLLLNLFVTFKLYVDAMNISFVFGEFMTPTRRLTRQCEKLR